MTAGELEAAAVENDGRTGRQEKAIVILSALGPQPKGLGCPDRLCQQPSLNQGPQGPGEHHSLGVGKKKEILESLGCDSLKRRLNSVSPARHTAPSPQDIWPRTLACSKDAVKALPTLTKNRWCFPVKELLQFLRKTKAPLLAPCWDGAGIRAPLQTHAHVITSLDKTSPMLAGPAQHSASSQQGCSTARGAACSQHAGHIPGL